MKNTEIFKKNGFVFDPFEHFPITSKVFRQNLKELSKLDLGPGEIIRKLEIFKKSQIKLTKKEQEVRDVLTYLLFLKIKMSDPLFKGVSMDLIRKEDPEALKMLELVKSSKPFHHALLDSTGPAIPSRFQRSYYQILILSGYNCYDFYFYYKLGYHREIEAIRLLR